MCISIIVRYCQKGKRLLVFPHPCHHWVLLFLPNCCVRGALPYRPRQVMGTEEEIMSQPQACRLLSWHQLPSEHLAPADPWASRSGENTSQCLLLPSPLSNFSEKRRLLLWAKQFAFLYTPFPNLYVEVPTPCISEL